MKASFLLRLSPVILLEPALGLEGELCSGRGGGGLSCPGQVNSSEPVSHEPPHSGVDCASYLSGEGCVQDCEKHSPLSS